MESMRCQTVPTNDFVLVCDGPLTDELNAVINKEQKKLGRVLQVLRLEKNDGLGNALNEGLKICKNELVARMDSDDISRPYRCEKQLVFLSDIPILAFLPGRFLNSSQIQITRKESELFQSQMWRSVSLAGSVIR